MALTGFQANIKQIGDIFPDRYEHKRRNLSDNCAFSQRQALRFIFRSRRNTLEADTNQECMDNLRGCCRIWEMEHITSILGKPCNKGLHFLSIYIYRYKNMYIYIYSSRELTYPTWFGKCTDLTPPHYVATSRSVGNLSPTYWQHVAIQGND